MVEAALDKMAVPVFDHTHLQDLLKTMELLHKSYAFYTNMLGRGDPTPRFLSYRIFSAYRDNGLLSAACTHVGKSKLVLLNMSLYNRMSGLKEPKFLTTLMLT